MKLFVEPNNSPTITKRESKMHSKSDRRPQVSGKFLRVDGDVFYIRGVTYGTFRPRSNGDEYPEPEVVEKDFSMMAAHGFNAIRTYTPPPRWVLDTAAKNGLYVMVGVPLDYRGYRNERRNGPKLEQSVQKAVRGCAGHQAVLFYAVGNEIPASVVRWQGKRKIERLLYKLYQTAKREDPDGLVTYVNYPSTEYLDLPFLDLVCFNVYLESQEQLEAYLPKLQTIAGDRPLIMSEVGLDSQRNGLEKQAQVLEWQVKTTFKAGCAGAFIYAWTDEWSRSGKDVLDWDFGLTTRSREAKPALTTVSETFSEVPFLTDHTWPMVSVVVCTYNGSRTLQETLDGLKQLRYPNFEVIVVDDGSTDGLTNSIAQQSGFRVIRTEQSGLSAARNTGWQEARGEIIAYIDDDAYPDSYWLHYLAESFMNSTHCGVGGPNVPPPDDGMIADCVANAPGGPVHILLTDQIAEHIPGCNMAFRKSYLEAVEGFDPQFRTAGDDVDLCWRLQSRGWTIGFNPAALVWHHRRNSASTYLRQQRGYGRAEALLERKWPEKYNAAGHISWSGRVYGKGIASLFKWSSRIYHGIWGSAPFQSIYEPAGSLLGALPLMPEWLFVTLILGGLTLLGLLWKPLFITGLTLFLIASSFLFIQAGIGAYRARFNQEPLRRIDKIKMRLLTGFLFLTQPLARLYGRIEFGLTPIRWRGSYQFTIPWPRSYSLWFQKWQSVDSRLESLEKNLKAEGIAVLRGGNFDRWDLEVRGGMLGSARLLMGIEEFGGGNQLVRYRIWPHFSTSGLFFSTSWFCLSFLALIDGALIASLVLGSLWIIMVLRILFECIAPMALLRSKLIDPKPLELGSRVVNKLSDQD
jgi:glycosyltransferase involved in cell wall biosynthesis